MTNELQAEEPGVADSCADTVRTRVLPESTSQQPPHREAPVQGFDPYSSDIGALTAPAKPRRTLDDMRRLSEAILRSRLAK